MKIGIIGNGFVGNATRQLLCNDINILSYDITPHLCDPVGTTMNDLVNCEFIFVTVPTPMKENGECYIDIVKTVVNELKSLNYQHFIVLRSTVPVGTSDNLDIYFMPEFLTETNYINDFINNKDWVFGMSDNNKKNEDFKKQINKLFSLAKKMKE